MTSDARLTQAFELLIGRFTWPDDEDLDLIEARAILEELGPQAINGLIKASQEVSPAMRFAAAYGMLVLRFPEFLPHLGRLAREDETGTALSALISYGEDGAEYLPNVLNGYQSSNDWKAALSTLYSSSRLDQVARGLAKGTPEVVFPIFLRGSHIIDNAVQGAAIGRQRLALILWEICYQYGFETTVSLAQTHATLVEFLKTSENRYSVKMLSRSDITRFSAEVLSHWDARSR